MRGFLVETVRKLVRVLYRTPVLGRVLNALAKEREHTNVMDIEDRLRRGGFDTLKFGPFQGMKYPRIQHYGYASLPMKFLGTYERELHRPVEESLKRGYKVILNIGAADGYYACGYAYRLLEAKVIAWEMLPFVAGILKSFASANDLSQRVEVRGLCTPEELRSISTKDHTLVFSDCEGAELQLLTHENLAGLKSYDLIVECHDHIVPNVTQILADRFADTHAIQIVDSVSLVLDDVPHEGLAAAGGPSIELYRALEENRLFAMRWIVATDKRV